MFLLLLLRFCLSQTTYNYQAFNLSCIDSNYISSQTNSRIYVNIPNFYYGKIEVDLRHINSNDTLKNVALFLAINNTDTDSNFTQQIPLNISVGSYSLYADNNLIINAYFSITDKDKRTTTSKSYLFSQSVSITIIPANPQGTSQNSFLFLVTNQDFISLPYNMITSSNANKFNGYFLSQINGKYSIYSRQKSVQSYSDYWYGLQSTALPYIPYFSNCQDSGNYLYFSQLIHNSSTCQLYGDNPTPINQFYFGSTAKADTCSISRKCTYDQIPSVSNEYPYWNTLSTVGETLFLVTSSEQSSNQLTTNFASNELVPCKLDSTSGTNSSDSYPLKVTLNFGYYQMTETQRKIITCSVQYSLYTKSSSNFTYDLVINFSPLSHTKIMLNFGFNWFIYMLVFMIIGSISNFQFFIFWCYNWIVSGKQNWHFNVKIYLRLYKQIMKGALPAFGIIITITFVIEVVMNGTFFGKAIFNNFSTFWNFLITNNVGYFASTTLANVQTGRMGFSYMIIAGYLMVVVSDYLIGKQRKKKEYEDYEIMGRMFKPRQWNRGKFLFVTFTYIFLSIMFLYFTYSNTFSSYIWYIIALMQIIQMVVEQIAFSTFDDQLPCLPLKISLGVLAYLATMGAIDLYYFILGYLVDVAISLIEITYLNQLQEKITKFIQEKSKEINRFYINLLNDEGEQMQKNSRKQENQEFNNQILINQQSNNINFYQRQVEQSYNLISLEDIVEYQEQKVIRQKFIKFLVENNNDNENKRKDKHDKTSQKNGEQFQINEFQSKKIELIIDCTCNMLQYMVQPIIVFILWITYQTSTILSSFAIAYQNCILYLLSSVVLAIFFQFNIIIIFNVLELYLNFDYKPLISKYLDRFYNRETFWITDEDKIDKSIEIMLRSCDSYSMSSQMFFHVTLYALCMYQFINGVFTVLSAQYNFFKDPYALLVLFFWITMIKIAIWGIKKMAYLLDIWGSSSLSKNLNQGTGTNGQFISSHEEQTNQMFIKKSERSSTLKFTFKNIQNTYNEEEANIKKFEEQQKKKILQSKLKTICKKLQPQFQKQNFKLQFAKKNKDFIRKNIQKILPLIKQFPQNDAELMGKSNNIREKQVKGQSKNCDPIISDFLAGWTKRVQTNRSKRQEKGYEHQGELKRCNFCFKSWGLYYGYGGMCLECSRLYFKSQEAKKED